MKKTTSAQLANKHPPTHSHFVHNEPEQGRGREHRVSMGKRRAQRGRGGRAAFFPRCGELPSENAFLRQLLSCLAG